MYFINKTGTTAMIGGYGLGVTCYHSFLFAVVVSLDNGLFTQVA